MSKSNYNSGKKPQFVTQDEFQTSSHSEEDRAKMKSEILGNIALKVQNSNNPNTREEFAKANPTIFKNDMSHYHATMKLGKACKHGSLMVKLYNKYLFFIEFPADINTITETQEEIITLFQPMNVDYNRIALPQKDTHEVLVRLQ